MTVSCDECRELYDNHPPCHECNKPELTPENERVFCLWQICNSTGRNGMNGALMGSFVLDLCSAYGETIETFELIVRLETHLWPLIQEKQKKQNKDTLDG